MRVNMCYLYLAASEGHWTVMANHLYGKHSHKLQNTAARQHVSYFLEKMSITNNYTNVTVSKLNIIFENCQ